MSWTTWAENEIRLACKRENPEWDGKSFDYGCSCYQSALKAYRSLMEDGHSGFSFSLTKQILIRLMDGKPLAPITDDDFFADGVKPHVHEDGETDRQCPRMSSLFRFESKDGKVKYIDVDRTVCLVDTYGKKSTCHNPMVSNIVDDMFPISMPYMPPDRPFEVYCEEFLSDKSNGDYDTIGMFYIVTPNFTGLDIERYWTEKDGRMVEIEKDEYEELKKKADELEKQRDESLEEKQAKEK